MRKSIFRTSLLTGIRWRWAWPSLLALSIGLAIVWWPSETSKLGGSSLPSTQASKAMTWQLVLNEQPLQTSASIDDPEAQVRLIYQALGEGQRQQALQLAEQLSLQFPNFQLGQLLYADLLNISTQTPQAQNQLLPEHESVSTRLKDLVLEAQRRMTHPDTAQVGGKRPSQLLMLGKEHPYLVVVDASTSRLYWFANTALKEGGTALKLLSNTYVSVGQNGIGKNKEGDGKTPLGVYFTQRKLSGHTLPDLFGAGAITLNYPNAVDLWRGRTGTGIWIHGTPRAQYTRAPLATDGCVVVANPKMRSFLDMNASRMTPVIIAEHIDWVDAQAPAPEPQQQFQITLQQWMQARTQASSNEAQLRRFYSDRFERDALDIGRWWPQLLHTAQQTPQADAIRPTSILFWHDQEDLAVVTFQHNNHPVWGNAEYWRTYWVREDGHWKIVFEGPT